MGFIEHASERLNEAIDWTSAGVAPHAASVDERLAALCAHWRERAHPRFVFDVQDRTAALRLLRRCAPEDEARMLHAADKALAHTSSPPVFPELSSLRRGYLLTGSEEYVEAGVRDALQWAAAAPEFKDVRRRKAQATPLHWSMRLYAAMEFFAGTRDAGVWTDEVLVEFMVLIVEHSRESADYAPWFWHNIPLSGIVSVHLFALYFPEFAQSAEWAAITLRDLDECFRMQVRADGSHREQTPTYHGAVIGHFARAVLMRRVNGCPVPEQFMDALRRMGDFVQAIMTPAGTYPAVNDTGRGKDRRAALSVAALAADAPRYRWGRLAGFHYFEFPADLVEHALQRDVAPLPPASVHLRDSGYMVMRSGLGEQDVHLLFDAGPLGYYHGHLDLFSITLAAGRRELIPDPGTYAYELTPENIGFHATASHNTINLDALSHRPFESEMESLAHVTQWDTASDGSVRVSAFHTAYDHLWGKPTVRRQIYFDGRSVFVIVDRIDCEKEGESLRPHALVTGFNLPDAEHVRAEPDEGWAATTFSSGPNVFIRSLERSAVHRAVLHRTVCNMDEGLRECRRYSACINADRGWIAHVLCVAEGEPRSIDGTARGDACGVVEVTVELGEMKRALSFGPDAICEVGEG